MQCLQIMVGFLISCNLKISRTLKNSVFSTANDVSWNFNGCKVISSAKYFSDFCSDWLRASSITPGSSPGGNECFSH